MVTQLLEGGAMEEEDQMTSWRWRQPQRWTPPRSWRANEEERHWSPWWLWLSHSDDPLRQKQGSGWQRLNWSDWGRSQPKPKGWRVRHRQCDVDLCGAEVLRKPSEAECLMFSDYIEAGRSAGVGVRTMGRGGMEHSEAEGRAQQNRGVITWLRGWADGRQRWLGSRSGWGLKGRMKNNAKTTEKQSAADSRGGGVWREARQSLHDPRRFTFWSNQRKLVIPLSTIIKTIQ